MTKATDEELSELQVIFNELIDQTIQSESSSVRRLTLNIIERLKMNEDNLRTDFLFLREVFSCFFHILYGFHGPYVFSL